MATECTRGPWSPQHQHGGPPAALLARAMEGLAGEGTALARLTFDFLRPVPIAPLTVRVEVARAGAKVLRLQGALVAADRNVCVQASAVALRTTHALTEFLGDREPAPPPLETAVPFQFPFFVNSVGYHTAVEVRIAPGTWGKGPVAAWMRTRVPVAKVERLKKPTSATSFS